MAWPYQEKGFSPRRKDLTYFYQKLEETEKTELKKEFEVLEIVRTSNVFVKLKHNCGEECLVRHSLYLKDSFGCKKCRYKKIGDIRQLSEEQIRDTVERSGEFKLEEIIRSNHTRVKVKHKECGTMSNIDYNNIRNGWLSCNNPICRNLVEDYGSKAEKELLEYTKTLDETARKSPRGELSPREIDIYSPKKKIGFEYNGLYWHSSATGKSRNYHKGKTDANMACGIKIIHLWEHWTIDKCKNIIQAKLGKTKKLYGPKLELRYVTKEQEKEFFNKYHVQNFAASKKCYGLYHKDELISAMSIRSKQEYIEIARAATKTGLSVIEGFSIFLNRIIEEYPNNDLLSYALRDLCPDYRDSVYYKLGFEYMGDSGPTLQYTDCSQVFARQDYQKHKLRELFPESYSEERTEADILYENKIYQIYDSGNHKFIYRR